MQLIIRDPDQYGVLRCMDCEVQENVVFLKENGCQKFKDDDNCCVENCELDHNNISNLLKYELARNSGDVSSEQEVLLYISSRAQESSFSNHDCIHHGVKHCDADQEKLMEDDKTVPSETSDVSTDGCSSKKESSERQNFSTSQQIILPSLSQLFHWDDLRDQEHQNHQEDPTMKTISAYRNSEVDLQAERIKGDSGTQRNTDDKDKNSKSAGVELSPDTESSSETMDYMSKLPLLASSSSRRNTISHHRELGSSSFSAASTPSGRLTFSGLIPLPDNISIRSNSTASARSFAFPILATEWNESPIRMAEADEMPRRSGCWKMCFTCSKF